MYTDMYTEVDALLLPGKDRKILILARAISKIKAPDVFIIGVVS